MVQKDIDFMTLPIIECFANVVESAVKNGYDLIDFLQKTFQTNIFEQFLEDYTLYSQSELYIISKLKKELQTRSIPTFEEASSEQVSHPYYYKEVAYWLGYTIMYWRVLENIDLDILVNLDIQQLIYTGFEPLHTQSTEYAINAISKGYVLSRS